MTIAPYVSEKSSELIFSTLLNAASPTRRDIAARGLLTACLGTHFTLFTGSYSRPGPRKHSQPDPALQTPTTQQEGRVRQSRPKPTRPRARAACCPRAQTLLLEHGDTFKRLTTRVSLSERAERAERAERTFAIQLGAEHHNTHAVQKLIAALTRSSATVRGRPIPLLSAAQLEPANRIDQQEPGAGGGKRSRKGIEEGRQERSGPIALARNARERSMERSVITESDVKERRRHLEMARHSDLRRTKFQMFSFVKCLEVSST